MTKTLDMAIKKARSLSEDKQAAIAKVIFELADETPYLPTLAERQAIKSGLVQAEAGEFASEAGVEATFAKLKNLRPA